MEAPTIGGIEDLEQKQREFSSRVAQCDPCWLDTALVAGVDVAYSENTAFACAVVLNSTNLSIVTVKHMSSDINSAYIPGLLFLREGKPMIELLRRMNLRCPVLVDGNGRLHPRRFGLACSIGLELGATTIGVAKKLMLGKVADRTGDSATIVHEGETVGTALWLGGSKRPVYVSVGNNVSLTTAADVVRKCSVYSQPEPLRLAHSRARMYASTTCRTGHEGESESQP